jgi:hypothetical protein
MQRSYDGILPWPQHDAQTAQQVAAELQLAMRPEGEEPRASHLGRLAGAIAAPAADDLRRAVQRAAWRPRAVLRTLWARDDVVSSTNVHCAPWTTRSIRWQWHWRGR